MRKPDARSRLRLGVVIFVILMIVEVAEYIIGASLNSGATAFLVFLAVPGAGLIVYYYMHISQLWRPEE